MKTTEELFRSVRMYACVSSELWDWKLSPFKMLKSCVCFLAAASGAFSSASQLRSLRPAGGTFCSRFGARSNRVLAY